MADFGTILNKDNKTLDLYCNSINTNGLLNAYASLTGDPNQRLCVVGTPAPVSFLQCQQKLLNSIIPNANYDTFSIYNKGTYIVSVSVQMNVVSVAGSQSQLILSLNGSTSAFDIGYSNSISDYLYKGTIICPIVKLTDETVP